MSVGVEGDLYILVAEYASDDGDVRAHTGEDGDEGVPEVVEADRREVRSFEIPAELLRNVGGVDINPALAGENETRLGRVGAGLQALFDLALSVTTSYSLPPLASLPSFSSSSLRRASPRTTSRNPRNIMDESPRRQMTPISTVGNKSRTVL